MVKRARGSSTRPGQRARMQRTSAARAAEATASTPTVKPAGLTADEEARAAQLEAQIVAEERAAETSAKRDRGRRAAAAEPVVRSGTIASRAAVEYAYVMRDVRKIVTIGGGLIVLLIVLWLVITTAGVGPF